MNLIVFFLLCFFFFLFAFFLLLVFIAQHDLTQDNLERLRAAPKLQVHNYASKCSRCQCQFKLSQSVIQWAFLEFCNTSCFESFVFSNYNQCYLCAQSYDAYLVTCLHIGNQLYYFCSDSCEKTSWKTFAELMIFCKFCRNLISSLSNKINGFCSADCQHRFDRLYSVQSTTKKPCHQCHSSKVVTITLLSGDTIYEFCSFSCYFYEKITSGLYPGALTKNYH